MNLKIVAALQNVTALKKLNLFTLNKKTIFSSKTKKKHETNQCKKNVRKYTEKRRINDKRKIFHLERIYTFYINKFLPPCFKCIRFSYITIPHFYLPLLAMFFRNSKLDKLVTLLLSALKSTADIKADEWKS